MQSADKDTDGKLDREQFRAFVKMLKRRGDIEMIFQALSPNGEAIDFDTYQKFMRQTQKVAIHHLIHLRYSLIVFTHQSTLDDGALLKVFHQYTNTKAGALPEDTQNPNATQPEAALPVATSMSLEQFSRFLLSKDNAPFSPHERTIWQDMTRPLSDYYLSSSHNTYLVGHQLVGVSTIEGYIRALLYSCRTVERAFSSSSSFLPPLSH